MMKLTRRQLIRSALASFAASELPWPVFAQQNPAPGEAPATPIIFVHGNGDHAALWITTLWRFESNGYPRERMLAFNFTDPLARADDAVAEKGRSSTEDQLRELTAAIKVVREETSAARVALVASSRGGYAVRNFIQNGGAAQVSHAVLCGVPNKGVFNWEANPGSEFNGRAPFLQRLNGGDTDVVAGTAFLTLRSDGNDKYAQPDGRFVGKPGVPTGITFEGPELRGATNLVLGALDHHEIAFHPRAFAEMHKFIVGREPKLLAIAPEPGPVLAGLVTGLPGGTPTNRPLAGATVEVYRVSPESGARIGAPIHNRVTTEDGRWGALTVDPAWYLEFMIQAAEHPTTHIYRSPFPRSSTVVHLRSGRPLAQADAGAGAVVLMSRPRGYFGIPRDVVRLDGQDAKGITPGVPTDSVATLRLAAGEVGRPVAALFNDENITARAWPAAENRITIAELTY
jgi:pimeloyl-ACP methyl ester carboxylesterase